ncbi:MAG: hypothetical protein JXA33_20975 [Anaerolineae bacterium]|nr:hypothetical protein [Anaerolineae bacterium]
MLTTIQGIYRAGKIELAEIPYNVSENTPVIVTFLDSNTIDLSQRGIDKIQAAMLRERLITFAEEWDSPEMDIYDTYGLAKNNL